jgi:hypothetical protein
MTVNTLNWAGHGPIIILNFLHFNWRKIALVTSIFAPTHHKNTKILHNNLMRLGQMLLGSDRLTAVGGILVFLQCVKSKNES